MLDPQPLAAHGLEIDGVAGGPERSRGTKDEAWKFDRVLLLPDKHPQVDRLRHQLVPRITRM